MNSIPNLNKYMAVRERETIARQITSGKKGVGRGGEVTEHRVKPSSVERMYFFPGHTQTAGCTAKTASAQEGTHVMIP